MPKRIESDAELYTGVDSQEEIRVCLNCGRPSCCNCMAYKHKTKTKKYWDIDRLKAYLDEGKTTEELVEIYGCSRSNVRTVINYWRKRGRL